MGVDRFWFMLLPPRHDGVSQSSPGNVLSCCGSRTGWGEPAQGAGGGLIAPYIASLLSLSNDLRTLMMRTGSSPGGQRSAPPWGWWLPVPAMAVATTAAAVQVPANALAAVIGCGVAGTLALALTVAELLRRGRALATLQAEYAEHQETLRRNLHQQELATVQLAKDRLPEAVERLQEGEFAEDVLQLHGSGRRARRRIPGRAPGVAALGRRRRARPRRPCATPPSAASSTSPAASRPSSTGRPPTCAAWRTGTASTRTSSPTCCASTTAPRSSAVSPTASPCSAAPGPAGSGARPSPSTACCAAPCLAILDYQRVELHSVADVAVVGPAVEPLIHALAELLDNATRYSPPKARVHLTAGEVHAGIAIEIEDGGVGLSEEAREPCRAACLKEAQAGIDLNDLGEAPRLGLAVVGRLVAGVRLPGLAAAFGVRRRARGPGRAARS